MQTFLPYPDFEATAAVLDDLRLGKQRVETLQIIRALTWPTYGWKHHPAVLMWKGYEEALGSYGVVICRAWTSRGRADTCEATMGQDLATAGIRVPPRSQAQLRRARALPPWLGDEQFHRSHRAALLRKDPAWYEAAFGPEAEGEEDVSYVWPVRKGS